MLVCSVESSGLLRCTHQSALFGGRPILATLVQKRQLLMVQLHMCTAGTRLERLFHHAGLENVDPVVHHFKNIPGQRLGMEDYLCLTELQLRRLGHGLAGAGHVLAECVDQECNSLGRLVLGAVPCGGELVVVRLCVQLALQPHRPQRNHPGVLPAVRQQAGDARLLDIVQHVLEAALRRWREQDGAESRCGCLLPGRLNDLLHQLRSVAAAGIWLGIHEVEQAADGGGGPNRVPPLCPNDFEKRRHRVQPVPEAHGRSSPERRGIKKHQPLHKLWPGAG
mmetsp:Transcript_813/g.1896  ORF Transcript_813/g.1896 Transcript_813/m.1896 type:complete len:280 (-) Transcript_813:868-1707(-)